MYGICCGSVRCLLGSGVFCVALSRQTRNDYFLLPFWLVVVFPLALSGSVIATAGAIWGWHGWESWVGSVSSQEIQGVLSAKLMLQLARGQIFQQLPQITFTFHKSSCCLSSCSSALLDQVGMPPLDLLPPASAPLRRRPLCVGVFPPSPSPLSSFSRGIGRCFSDGQRPRSALPSGDAFIDNDCQLLYLYLFLCIVCISIFVLFLYRFLLIKYPQLLTTTKSECMQNL